MPIDTAEDRAYENRSYIPGADDYAGRWAKLAAGFRSTAEARLDVAYGVDPRERYDLFLPKGAAPKGLATFVHGGYWMAFDKSYWSHLAAGPVARGYAVMVPSYPLCPDVRIGAIGQSIGAALTHAAKAVPGPIMLSGHSAGGHLVSRMACTDAPLPADVQARLSRLVSISGLHDLRPLMSTKMNETLQITHEEARRESPALLDPLPLDVVAWVGDGERPQLRRQSRLLAMIWEGLTRSMRYCEAPDRHHLDVIADLGDADSRLTDALVG